MKEEKRRGREKERKEGRKKENCRVTIPLTLCVCVFMYFSCLLLSAPLAKQFPKASLSTQDNNSQTSKF